MAGNDMEVWVDIPGVPFYQASDLGRIRSLDRVVTQGDGRGGVIGRKFAGRILTPKLNSHGYLQVSVGSPARCVTVHKLVALAFLGPRDGGLEVNHKDGDKGNCRPENLEYATSTTNNHHALMTGLRKMKITDEQIEEIKSLDGRLSRRGIGRQFGIHHSYVRYLVDGKRKVKGG
jgi:hypothetical protein